METLKIIIVDDEDGAREVIRNLLENCTTPAKIIAECSSLLEGVAAIKKTKPDAVFLDIRMPIHPGYDIIKFFDEIQFDIVFITAYDQYAIKAFELSALDYIVKPVDRARLYNTITRISERKKQKVKLNQYSIFKEMIEKKELAKIVISELEGGKISKRMVNLSDIIAVEAFGSYSKLYLTNGSKITLSRNLKHFLTRLPEKSNLIRIHRSWIISKEKIEKVIPNSKEVYLMHNIVAHVSKNSIGQLI